MTFDKSGQQTSLNVRVRVQVLYRRMSRFDCYLIKILSSALLQELSSVIPQAGLTLLPPPHHEWEWEEDVRIMNMENIFLGGQILILNTPQKA